MRIIKWTRVGIVKKDTWIGADIDGVSDQDLI